MQSIVKNNEELKIRLFYVLSITAIVANAIGFISNAIIYGFTPITIFTLVCAIIMYIVGIMGMYTKNSKLPAVIILVLGNIIEFPVLYLAYGAYYILYMILGIVSTVLFLEEKWQIIGSLFIAFYDGIVIYIKVMYSHLFAGIEINPNLIAILVTYFIAMISIVMMSIILMKHYHLQQDKLSELANQLQEMVHLDPLTHIYNRRYLVEYLNKKMKIESQEFAVVLLDIDDFKSINDKYGHIYGDQTLQAFSDSMKKNMDNKGIVTRFGGEEFMLVFDDINHEVIEDTLNKVAEEFALYGKQSKGIELSFSGGVEVFYQEDEIVKLFNQADHKLYYAKHTGKKKIVFDIDV